MWIKTALGAHSADLQSADCLSQSQQAAEYAQSFFDQIKLFSICLQALKEVALM
jgi:hypothetical protein